MKKLNILFKRICAISLSSALFLGSVNASAFTAGWQSDAAIDIEDIETSGTDSGFIIEKNITFDDLDPEAVQENPAPILEVETMDDFDQKIVELEPDSYIDEYYYPEETDGGIQPFSLSPYAEQQTYSTQSTDGSQIAYFSEATNVKYIGHSNGPVSETHAQWGNLSYVAYNNSAADDSKYVVYENAVTSSENTTYDLVVFPFKCTMNGQVIIDNTTYGKIPAFRVRHTGYNGFKLKITEHNNINKPISIDVILGISDIDGVNAKQNEYVILPSDFEPIHIGSSLINSESTNPNGIKYRGSENGSDNKHTYDTGCLVGQINIPTGGITIYYGAPIETDDGHAARIGLTFDGIEEDIYTISFDANGGSGNIPSTITKYGLDTSVVMGDIGSTVLTRSGYTFKGWSADSTYSSSNKRIAYSSISGATTTSSSWCYTDYCIYTGGNPANRTLTLYAQWEPVSYSHTLAYNANGGANTPANSTVTNTSSTYNMIVAHSVFPTREGYGFKGYNTKADGTGTTYYPGDSVSVGPNATVTLYAQWAVNTYNITYNGNGNTGGSTASQTKNYNVAVNLQNNGFTKTGYHFTGWNTTANGSGTAYAAGAGYSTNANLTLYAQWAINTSTLKVKPNGGTWNGSTNEQSFTQNYNTTKSIPLPTRTGYTFTGWARTGTNGTMSSLVAAATYTFGAANGTTDTITAGWKVNNYTVTYIDVVDSKSGKELGRSTAAKPYNSTVRGADKGSSAADNAYYNGYYYFSDTSATVTTSGATVYRIFKQRMNTIAGNIIWIDWNNKNGSRPANVTLYIHGSDGKTYTYTITGDNIKNTSVNKWPYNEEVPKYDSNGNMITYTVGQDTAVSQEEGLAYKDPDVNGYDVTNEITNDDYGETHDYPIKVNVSITWNDNDDQHGFRPNAVTLQLIQNGAVIKTVDVADSYTFTELLKYDENGDLYTYTIQASDEDRYTKTENNAAPYSKSVTYTFIKPAYSVIIPKIVILDGNTGIGEYVVSVNGQIDDRDFVNVIPDKSFTMKNDYLSPITATVKQNRTVFTNKENIKTGAISNGTITTKSLAGKWSGSFNFNIYFEFGK